MISQFFWMKQIQASTSDSSMYKLYAEEVNFTTYCLLVLY